MVNIIVQEDTTTFICLPIWFFYICIGQPLWLFLVGDSLQHGSLSLAVSFEELVFYALHMLNNMDI